LNIKDSTRASIKDSLKDPSTFAGKTASGESIEASTPLSTIPLEVKESADRLGVDLSKAISREMIHRHWKQRIVSPENHPDLGGNTEKAILLNIARDQLGRWLDMTEPKLGKLFGGKNLNSKSLKG